MKVGTLMIQHNLTSLGLRWYKGYLIWKHGLGYWVWIILKSTVIPPSSMFLLQVQYNTDKVLTRRLCFFLQIHMKYYRLCHKCFCSSVPKYDGPAGRTRLSLCERVFASIRTYDLCFFLLSPKNGESYFQENASISMIFCHFHPIWPRYFFSM